MSNLIEFADGELDRITKDSEGIQDVMNSNVLDIVRIFSEQGHSGFSASYAIAQIRRLLDWKPLTPLTGEEDEWNGRQNTRYSAVFRNEDGTAYNIEGKIFTDNGGQSWYSCRESFVPVTFPYNVPESPTRVYKYHFDGNAEFEGPKGMIWQSANANGDVIGEFYGRPNEQVTYELTIGDKQICIEEKESTNSGFYFSTENSRD